MQYFLDKVNVEDFFLPTHVQALKRNDIEREVRINFEHLHLIPSMKLCGGANSISQKTLSTHNRIMTWNDPEERELYNNIQTLNEQLTSLGVIKWNTIRERLENNEEFRECVDRFFRSYDVMQDKLGPPKRTRGLEYNSNLQCIFYYYNNETIYKEEGNYLCRLDYHIFKKHRQDMEEILEDERNRTIENEQNLMSETQDNETNIEEPETIDELITSLFQEDNETNTEEINPQESVNETENDQNPEMEENQEEREERNELYSSIDYSTILTDNVLNEIYYSIVNPQESVNSLPSDNENNSLYMEGFCDDSDNSSRMCEEELNSLSDIEDEEYNYYKEQL